VIILKDILYKVAIEAVHGSTEVAGKIEFDSRKIEKTYFVAIRGSVSDGMNIFKSNRTRATIVCDTFPGISKRNYIYR
jgi:UDP-N-acetylmuramoyl-L-alanyl-D-glutamate--2,6-diaminopimelate ligase